MLPTIYSDKHALSNYHNKKKNPRNGHTCIYNFSYPTNKQIYGSTRY